MMVSFVCGWIGIKSKNDFMIGIILPIGSEKTPKFLTLSVFFWQMGLGLGCGTDLDSWYGYVQSLDPLNTLPATH